MYRTKLRKGERAPLARGLRGAGELCPERATGLPVAVSYGSHTGCWINTSPNSRKDRLQL